MHLQKAKKLRTMSFDIENRPLSYLGMDFTTAEITAIAAGFTDEKEIYAFLLGEMEPTQILKQFIELWEEADIVTGHYIRRHDLPIISGALVEYGMEPLSPKLVSDTKTDLRSFKGISKSQENLAEMLGVKAPKIQMNQVKWREANRLTEEGIALTRQRVVGDIKQHKAMRAILVEEGRLRPPTLWKP